MVYNTDMQNKKTPLAQPLRANETTTVLKKQILGEVAHNVEDTTETSESKNVLIEAPVSTRTSRKNK